MLASDDKLLSKMKRTTDFALNPWGAPQKQQDTHIWIDFDESDVHLLIHIPDRSFIMYTTFQLNFYPLFVGKHVSICDNPAIL